MAKSKRERVYQPVRTFDDKMDLLSKFYFVNEIAFGDVNGKALKKAAKIQRKERTEDGHRTAEAAGSHLKFIRNQRSRYGLFSQALELAEARYKHDPAKLKELESFRTTHAQNGNGDGGDDPTSK